MNPEKLKILLKAIQAGNLTVEEGLERLRDLPFEDVGVALIDHHRQLRLGAPEIILGEAKTGEQILTIVNKMVEHGSNILITRLSGDKADLLSRHHSAGQYDLLGRTFTLVAETIPITGQGRILVICAGTSDLPVAREAVVTARMLGNEVDEIVDVGVAGLHRLLARSKELREAAVIIVVAGMEGALPSVVGGMVDKPVIAVPTSVGYGAAFEGLAALLGMLNSCASGVTVVNIDNGFGAAFAASRINRAG